MPADLAVVVRQAVRVRLRLRQQQQPHVLVGVARQQDDFRRLEVLRAVDEVVDAGHPALRVDLDASSRVARVTTLSWPVACARGIVVTAVEFFASTWQPPRLQNP